MTTQRVRTDDLLKAILLEHAIEIQQELKAHIKQPTDNGAYLTLRGNWALPSNKYQEKEKARLLMRAEFPCTRRRSPVCREEN